MAASTSCPHSASTDSTAYRHTLHPFGWRAKPLLVICTVRFCIAQPAADVSVTCSSISANSAFRARTVFGCIPCCCWWGEEWAAGLHLPPGLPNLLRLAPGLSCWQSWSSSKRRFPVKGDCATTDIQYDDAPSTRLSARRRTGYP